MVFIFYKAVKVNYLLNLLPLILPLPFTPLPTIRLRYNLHNQLIMKYKSTLFSKIGWKIKHIILIQFRRTFHPPLQILSRNLVRINCFLFYLHKVSGLKWDNQSTPPLTPQIESAPRNSFIPHKQLIKVSSQLDQG